MYLCFDWIFFLTTLSHSKELSTALPSHSGRSLLANMCKYNGLYIQPLRDVMRCSTTSFYVVLTSVPFMGKRGAAGPQSLALGGGMPVYLARFQTGPRELFICRYIDIIALMCVILYAAIPRNLSQLCVMPVISVIGLKLGVSECSMTSRHQDIIVFYWFRVLLLFSDSLPLFTTNKLVIIIPFVVDFALSFPRSLPPSSFSPPRP